MTTAEDFIMAVLFSFILALALGLGIGGCMGQHGAHQEALKKHLAHYDSSTGEFTWGWNESGLYLPPLPKHSTNDDN